MNWSELYDSKDEKPKVQFADIGCGYGGLLSILKIYYIYHLFYLKYLDLS